jgi:hypothetical protein
LPSAWLCQQVFGQTPLVNATLFNQTYDTPFLQASPNAPSNIFFTYGADDVWTQIGLASQKNENSKISINLITGAGHHYDLNAVSAEDSAGVIAARAQFVQLAKLWLAQ